MPSERLTMNITLAKAHISNYRSIREITIDLKPLTVLFGANDGGKSNIIKALGLALSSNGIDESDVFVSDDYPTIVDKKVTVDLLFVPVDPAGNRLKVFDDDWGLHLGISVSTDDDENEYFAFRTEFAFDADRKDFLRTRQVITQWTGDTISVGETIGQKTLLAFDFILLDAHRDLADDIRDKRSRWNRELSKIELDDETRINIEGSLTNLGGKIVEESKFLTKAQVDLQQATIVSAAEATINPISRTISDLYKGLDVYLKQEMGSSLPISNYGSGTRSRAVFSVLNTILQARVEASNDYPYYCLIAFEEPEVHVHPHAQKQLLHSFAQTPAQRLLTTHSPYLLTTASLENLVCVSLSSAETRIIDLADLGLDPEELRKINRFVLNTRGEILFSPIVILVEGETEEQALPVFIKERFGKEAFELGISVIGVGGKTYRPFIKILNTLDVRWFIFSDGESNAIRAIEKAVKDLFSLPGNPDLASYANVVVLDGGNNYESYLLRSGYQSEIKLAINESEKENDFIGPAKTYLENYKDKRPNLQALDEESVLAACMKDGKTKYAIPIAKVISSLPDERKYPSKHKELLLQIESALGVGHEAI